MKVYKTRESSFMVMNNTTFYIIDGNGVRFFTVTTIRNKLMVGKGDLNTVTTEKGKKEFIENLKVDYGNNLTKTTMKELKKFQSETLKNLKSW